MDYKSETSHGHIILLGEQETKYRPSTNGQLPEANQRAPAD